MGSALRQRNRKKFQKIRLDRRRKMYTGKLVNGVIVMTGAPTNKTWVRYPKDSAEETAVWGKITRANVPVWVDKNKAGQDYIVGAEFTEGTITWGNALETVASPPWIDALNPTSIDSLGFLPGRIGPRAAGGTWITIKAFEHEGGRFPETDVDVSAFYPAGDDQYGRIGVYVDPTTNTATAFAGEAVFDTDDFTDADKLSVPDGMYPVGAVIVYDGQAITGANTFEDWRIQHSLKGIATAASPLTTKGDLYTYDTDNARLPVGTDGQILYADSAETSGLKWDAAPSGSGFSQAYVGYNTVGGSSVAMVTATSYLKLVTLAADSLVVSIDARILQTSTSSVGNLTAYLLSDNAGVPGDVMALGMSYAGTPSFDFNSNNARWLSLPISVWLPAGTYWIAVVKTDANGVVNLYYDGSGADYTQTHGGEWVSDGVANAGAPNTGTPASTTNRYSIRASILT